MGQCSDPEFQPAKYTTVNGWTVIHIPKVETGECGLFNELNDRIKKAGSIEQMDIQYSNYDGCESTVFMLSDIMKENNPLLSSGHLSCLWGGSVSGQYYFGMHTDCDIVPASKKLNEKYLSTLSKRLQVLKDSSGIDTLTLFVGAGNIDSSDAYSNTIKNRINYFVNTIKETKVFAEVNVFYVFGPNSASLPINTMEDLDRIFELGGPDAVLTTDVIIFPADKTIYVIRPVNPAIFDAPFFDIEQQISLYQKHFKAHGESKFVMKLSEIKQ